MRLYTNPGSNLPSDLISRYNVAILPQRIVVDGVSHDTREPIANAEVERWVKEAKRWPSTIGTTAAETVQAFADSAKDGEREHIVITTSKLIINSHQSAEVAARTFKDSPQGNGHQVAVVDSTVTDVGAGMLVVLAGEAIKAGQSFAEVVKLCDAAAAEMRFAFAVTTLENMVKGGRASVLRAFVADMLGVRPVLGFVGGAIQVVGKYNRRGDMVVQLSEWLRAQVPPRRKVWLGLAHTGDSAPLWRLKELMAEHVDVAGVFHRPLAPGVYLHAGPGAVSAGFLPIDSLPWTPPADIQM